MPLVLTDITPVEGGQAYATLTLNNPDERNTLTAPMVAEIIAAMDAIEGDERVAALVVTGTAPAFCAGANLGNLAESTEESLGGIYEGFLRIARSSLPTRSQSSSNHPTATPARFLLRHTPNSPTAPTVAASSDNRTGNPAAFVTAF